MFDVLITLSGLLCRKKGGSTPEVLSDNFNVF
jgi:hypothetical protein